MAAQTAQTSRQRIDWIRVTRLNPCPICNRSDWCEVNYTSQRVHCMRVSSEWPSQHRLGGWYHFLTSDKIKPEWYEKAKEQEARRAEFIPLTPEQIDTVFRRMLELCPLAEEHRAAVAADFPGVDPALVGSFYRQQWYSLGETLAHEFGFEIANSHPALTYKLVNKGGEEREMFVPNCYDGGLLLPALDHQGRIVGLQLRKDKPRGKDDRYRWVSADGKGGTPLCVLPTPGSDTVLLVEGLKKTAQGRAHYNCHAISFAGVSAWDEEELLATLDALGAARVLLAFDQDKHTNAAVKRAEARMLDMLTQRRPYLQLATLEWPAEFKGLDDVLQAGAAPVQLPYQGKRPKVLTDLPLSMHTAAFGGPLKPTFTLAQARTKHRELFDRLLTQPNTERIAVTSVTGTGKSTAADNAVASLALADKLEKRVLILCPDKANIDERTAPGTLLGQAVAAGKAAIQKGRNLIESSATGESIFDCRNQEASQAGAARHIPAKVACPDCPFGSDENWAKAFPDAGPRKWKCEQEGYLYSRKVSKAAQAVVGTKEAYLNGSKEIEKFDVVIVDESLLDKLLEVIHLGQAEIATWRARAADKGMNLSADVLGFFELLETTLDALADKYPAAKASEEEPSQIYPVMEALAESAAQLGLKLENYQFSYLPGEQLGAGDCYDFEKSYQGRDGKLRIPFRAAADFLDALTAGNLRLGARRSPSGKFTFEIRKIRTHLVNTLKAKTLVVLDATLPPQLKALFPDIKEIRYDVRQALYTVQTTNALYTQRDLYRQEARTAIEKTAAKFFEGANNPLAYVPLRFESEMDMAGATVDHWGQHRATNQYSDCDRLLLVGHHMRPLADIKAEVNTLRSYGYLSREGEQAGAAPGEKLRLYNFAGDGKAAGRWCKADNDTALQEAIEHDYQQNIVQAIGRLRAALRPAHRPAIVLIMCAEPVGDLLIDQLTTVKELLADHAPLFSTFPQINTWGTVENDGAWSAPVETEPKSAPRPLWYGLLDLQTTPEGIDNVLNRVADRDKPLLDYAGQRRKELLKAV